MPIPEFVEEGTVDGRPVRILPLAKSTEILFVNKTAFLTALPPIQVQA